MQREGIRARAYALLTDPTSSMAARWCNYYFSALTVGSLLLFCCETMPAWSRSAAQRTAWLAVESVVAAHYAMDAVAKAACQPSPGAYVLSWAALVDACSVVPWAIEVLWLLSAGHTLPRNFSAVRLLRLLRLLRFTRTTIAAIPRIHVFERAIKKSGIAFLFLALYIGGAGLLLSGCIYLAETSACTLDREGGAWLRYAGEGEQRRATPCSVNSMFDAMWVFMVTMTTVGYGDVVPLTVAGKAVAVVIMLASLVMLPLPIAIFGANLTELYLEARMVRRARRTSARLLLARGGDSADDCDALLSAAGDGRSAYSLSLASPPYGEACNEAGSGLAAALSGPADDLAAALVAQIVQELRVIEEKMAALDEHRRLLDRILHASRQTSDLTDRP